MYRWGLQLLPIQSDGSRCLYPGGQFRGIHGRLRSVNLITGAAREHGVRRSRLKKAARRKRLPGRQGRADRTHAAEAREPTVVAAAAADYAEASSRTNSSCTRMSPNCHSVARSPVFSTLGAMMRVSCWRAL